MSYFNEIADYATYSGHEADFHFTYNANSGGGQAFLGGRFYDENGQLTSPESLNGKIAVFKYIFRSKAGEELSVIVNDEKAKYEIKPRGNGSTSMKLGIGTDRIAPSKVVSSFMMLPPTCGVKTPSNLQLSILSANNYWLQSMWLECSTSTGAENEAVFTVKDCIFGGGVSKETPDRAGRYFKLNIEKRMADIITLASNTDIYSEEITQVIKLFSDIYLGIRAFNYEECTEATKTLMESLAQQFPDVYSGITDPVPALLDIAMQKSPEEANGTDVFSDNESAFKDWLSHLPKANGELYAENTRNQYISALKAVTTQFADAIAPFTSVFEIADAEPLERAVAAIKSDDTYEEFNRSHGNGSLSAGLDLYKRFLLECKAEPIRDICYRTGYHSEFSRNRILFGAPGTGKSFTLNGDRKELLYGDRHADETTLDRSLYGEYERVTFHPDYSYANFVGTYKPVPSKDSDGKDTITYSYVPGPFMRTYVKALQNSRTDNPKPFLLVIEEINRANVAAVFGDVFQLLDRGDDEVSEYPIQASEDIKKYLAKELGGKPGDYSEIRIPDNMFIWATMNSADQGVFPMDTAFKRRWDFTYLGIDDSESGILGKKVTLGQGENRRIVEWNALRKAINDELLTYRVNEDKLMGPYFISRKNLPDGNEIDPVSFTRIFKNKVLMYLFDDAAKQKRPSLFAGCRDENKNLYSQICREFDTKGVFIFCNRISDRFLPEDD